MKAAEVLEKMRRLEIEHGEGGVLHREIAKLYSKWMAAGGLSDGEGTRLPTISEELQRLYREHIHVEENEVFPVAAKLLDREAVAAMGSEFRIRRDRFSGLTPPPALVFNCSRIKNRQN